MRFSPFLMRRGNQIKPKYIMTILLLWLLNLGISVFNSISVGAPWSECKKQGGFIRLVCWCGAIMAACGFSWCFLIAMAYGANHFDWLTDKQIRGMLGLGYLILIPPILGSGIGITIWSWMEFARRRTITNGLTAGYNTYAQVHNTWQAVKGISQSTKSVKDLFDDLDGDSAKGLVVLLLVAIALGAGIFLTWGLIRWADKKWVIAVDNQLSELSRRHQTA